MNFKKATSLLLVIFVLLLCVGCKKPMYEPAEVTKSVLSVFPASVSEKTIPLDIEHLDSYFGFGGDLLSDFSVVISSAEQTAFELGALELKDNDDINLVVDGIYRRHNDVSQALSYINTSSSTTGSRFLLMKLNDTIIYLICSDTSAAYETLTEMGAEEIK